MLRNLLSCDRRLKNLFKMTLVTSCALSLVGCIEDSRNQWPSPRVQTPAIQNQAMPPAPVVESSDMPMPAAATPARVAILLPLSGRGSDTGLAMLNAAQLAMADLKATSQFELLPEDTGKGARTAIEDALSHNVNLILGPVFSDNTKEITPVALQKGVPVLSFSTDTTAASGTTFIMGFVPQTQVEQILDYAALQDMRRIALIAPHDGYGDAASATFFAHMQTRMLNNAGIIRYNAGTLPAADQIKSLMTGRGPKPFDAVLIAAPGPEAAKISDALTAQGLPPGLVQRLGTGLWDQPETAQLPSLDGAWYAASSPRLRTRFAERYVATYHQQPPRLASLAYDATALAVILSQTGRGYDRNVLLDPKGFAGIDGIFRFQEDGLADRGLAILRIANQSATVIRDAPTSFAGQP